jgi:5'-nucleotidase
LDVKHVVKEAVDQLLTDDLTDEILHIIEQYSHYKYTQATSWDIRKDVRRLAEKVLEKGLPYGSLLNVNFPLAETYKRIKICKMALGTWKDEFTRHEVYYNKDYYWLGGVNIDDDPNDVLTDNWALNRGYIAITPIKIDETDYSLMDEVSSWDL